MGRELCLYLSYVHVLRFVSRLLNQDWIGLGTKSWEWEGMGTRKSFPHISNLQCNCSLLLIYRPRKDERLSWPGWVTYSGRCTHISGHPSAAGRAQDRESSSVKDRRSTTVPRNEPGIGVVKVMTWIRRKIETASYDRRGWQRPVLSSTVTTVDSARPWYRSRQSTHDVCPCQLCVPVGVPSAASATPNHPFVVGRRCQDVGPGVRVSTSGLL